MYMSEPFDMAMSDINVFYYSNIVVVVCMGKFMERTTNFICMHSRK